MPSADIRLRLVIRRHALPEVKLVWPCTASDDLTIARFLAAVNEVIPLESAHWGLEDYAVELADQERANFECLHFQRVNQVLKHDDQVLIRSLLTDDLRQRRVSGRDQISSDGKHLFDGIAFGRPWLRAPRDRPPLALPPRKRARIAYEPDVDDDDESTQLLIEDGTNGARALFGENALDQDSDEEDDADFEPAADTMDDQLQQSEVEDDDYEIDPKALGDELQLLQGDNGSGDDDDESNFGGLLEPNNAASALESIRLDWSEKLLILRSAFPGASLQAVRDEFLRQEEDLRKTHQVLSEHERPAKSFDEMMDDALCEPEGSHQLVPHSASRPRPLIEEVITEEQQPSSELTANAIAVDAPTLAHAADDAGRAGPYTSGLFSVSDRQRGPNESYIAAESSSSTDASSSESSSDSDGETGGQHTRLLRQIAQASTVNGLVTGPRRSASEDSGGSSDDEGALVNLTNELLGDSSDDSESDSSSDTDSDTSSDGESSDEEPTVVPVAVVKPSLQSAHNQPADTIKRPSATSRRVEADDSSSTESDSNSSDSSSDNSDDDDGPPSLSTKQPVVKPKETLTSTKVTPVEGAYTQGLTKTQKRNRRRALAKRMRPSVDSKTVDSPVDSLEARRQALLETVASEVAREAPSSEKARPEEGSPATSGPADDSINNSASAPGSVTASAESKPKPRMRMDLGAGRRMLFGALGLKNPKTKEDEQKIRSELLRGVRPIQNSRLEEAGKPKQPASDTTSDSTSESSDSDSDSDSASDGERSAAVPWQDKITYRAVECCQEGVTLSEPPFPFVQRWDPQQHYSVVRKRKRDSQAVFDESYVGDDSQWYDSQNQQAETNDIHTRKKNRNTNQASRQDTEDGAVNILDYDEPQAATAKTHEPEMDDLPALPSDVTTLPLLKNGEAKLGMVITWKAWKLSKSTGWSPALQSVTGLVLSAESEKPVELLLAMRDREKDERKFDEDTGERIFEKFESVDSGDEHEEDDGRRAILFSEMIEPRLVQNAPDIPLKPADVTPDKISNQAQSEAAPISISPASASTSRPAEDGEVFKEGAETLSIPSGQGPFQMTDNSLHQLMPSTSGSMMLNGTARHADDDATGQDNAVSSSEGSLRSFIDAPQANDEAETAVGGFDAEPRGQLQERASPTLSTADRAPQEQMRRSANEQESTARSQRSIASGRQPQSPSGSARMQMLEEDSMIPETGPKEIQFTPARANSVGSADSDPIPSLEEVFHTARMTKQAKAPIKSEATPAGKSRKGAEAGSDPGYLEAMQKLDEGDDSDRQSDVALPKRTLFPNATQPSFTIDLPTSHDKRGKKTQFVVPDDSQVIDLIDSEPPSPRQPADGKQKLKNDKASSLNGSTRKKSGKAAKKSTETVFHQPSDVESSPAQNTRQRRTSAPATHAKRGRGGGHRGRRRASERVGEV